MPAACRCFFFAALCLLSATSLTGQISSLEDLQKLLVTQGPTATAPAATAPVATPGETSKESTNPNIFYAKPGPWGTLRCTHIFLEAPKGLIDNFPLPNTQTRWAFPEASRNGLAGFFKYAGLSEAVIADLLDPKSVVVADRMLYLFPKIPDLEAISPETRAVIYTELAKYGANEFHVDPVLIIGQTVQEWYRTSKLRAELIQKIDKLCYRRGQTIAFSDISLLLNYAQSDSEARAIFKAMTRTRSLLVKIEVNRNSNVDELVNYWTLGLGLRRKDVEPLIQSIADTDGLEALPLSHMLPALVRKLLYTYPSLDMNKNGILPDCHWTSLNFFNYDPHEYLLDSRLATSAVLEKFETVEPPYKYGDILFFLNRQTGDAYHSCVYLADTLVYTKNGRNLLSPWLIMRQEDVEKIYLYRGDGRVQGFRMKAQVSAGR